MNLAQDGYQWRVVLDTVMYLGGSIKGVEFID